MTRVFRPDKKKKTKKGGLPQEYVDKIHAMRPEDVAVEMAREDLAVDALKKQMKEDQKIIDAEGVLEQLDDEIKGLPEIKKVQDQLDELIAAEKDNEDYSNAKLDVKLHKSEWQKDIRDRKKKIKLMKETINAHINSGALKLKN